MSADPRIATAAKAMEDLARSRPVMANGFGGVNWLDLAGAALGSVTDRERETMGQLNRNLIRDCANLTKRAETAERRNKGILAELSASGGRNIDLRQRAEATEAIVASVRELHTQRWTNNPLPGGMVCAACLEPVEDEPCSTVRALDGE